MSKKRFILFALVAAIVLSFAGSAMAATTENYQWTGKISNSWTTPGNWEFRGGPATIYPGDVNNNNEEVVVTFPSSVTTHPVIESNLRVQVEAIAVRGTLFDAPVGITVGTGATLAIECAGATLYNDIYEGKEQYRFIDAEASLTIKGAGKFDLTKLGAANHLPVIKVDEGATVDLNIFVDAANMSRYALKTDNGVPGLQAAAVGVSIAKTEKGTLNFTGSKPNDFSRLNNVESIIVIEDGTVGISAPNQLRGLTGIAFFDRATEGANPTLSALWATGSRTLGDEFDIWAISSGTINVANAAATFDLNQAGSVWGYPGVGAGAISQTINKTGPGTLELSTTRAWLASVEALDIREGTVAVTDTDALQDDQGGNRVSVNVRDDGTFDVDALQSIANLRAFVVDTPQLLATLILEEGSHLRVFGASSNYPGYITGHGTFWVDNGGDVRISGVNNDQTGDTVVDAGGRLRLNHEKNLGGYRQARLRLNPNRNPAGDVHGVGARLDVVESFTLPNVLVVGAAGVSTGVYDGYDEGGVRIEVPVNTRLGLPNVIDYNKNYIVKTGLGEIVLDNIGLNSHSTPSSPGSGSASWNFAVGQISVAWEIIEGTLRQNTATAADYGDIVVGDDATATQRAEYSLRNSLSIPNSILFHDQSTFSTEFVSANYGIADVDEGTIPAVSVGQVWGRSNYIRVWNRVDFNDLLEGTVTKGDKYSVMRAIVFREYSAQNVAVIGADNQTSAPFTADFNDKVEYVTATNTIDVPQFANEDKYEFKPGDPINISFAVTSKNSTVVPESFNWVAIPEVFVKSADLKVNLTGGTITITGTAPENRVESEDDTYSLRLNASSKSVGEVYGYENRTQFDIVITENPSGPVTPPVVNTENFNIAVATKTNAEISGTVKVQVIGGTATDVIPNKAFELKLFHGGTDPAGEALETLPLNSGETGTVTFAFNAGNYGYNAEYYIVASPVVDDTSIKEYTLPGFKTDPAGTVSTGSGGGCDAGFGVFGLLAATGAVALLRKKN